MSCLVNFIVETELHDRIELYRNEWEISECFVDKLIILCPDLEYCEIPGDVVIEANKG